MRKSHTNIVKFLNLLPEISPYAQTDGLPVSVNLNKLYNNKFVIFFNIKFFRLRKFLK